MENITGKSSGILATFKRLEDGAKRFGMKVDDSDAAVKRLARDSRSLNDTWSGMRNMMATLGVGYAVKSVVDYNDRLVTATSLTLGQTRNWAGLVEIQKEALRISDLTGESYLNIFDGMQNMLKLAKGNVKEAGNLTTLASSLLAITPEESFKGAMFALKELESGDALSLRERFRIRVPTFEEAKKIAKRDGSTARDVMFKALQDDLDTRFGGGEKGAGVSFLMKVKTQTIGGQMKMMGNQFQNLMSPMLVPFLKKVNGWLRDTNQWMRENKTTLQQFGQVALAVVPRVAAMYGLYKGFQLLHGGFRYGIKAVLDFKDGVIDATKWLWRKGAALLGNLRAVGAFGRQAVLATGNAIRGMIVYVGQLWATRAPMMQHQMMLGVALARTRMWLLNARMGVINYAKTLYTTTIPAMYQFIIGLNMATVRTWFMNTGLMTYVRSLSFAAIGQTLLNTVMMANPVGLVIGGILALSAAFYGLYKLADWMFPGFFAGVKEWFGKAWDFIYQWFVEPLMKVFKWIGDFTGISAAFSVTSENSMINETADADMMKQFGLGGDMVGLGLGGKNAGGIGLSERMNNGVSGERGSIKQITFNIQSLVKEISFTEIKDIKGMESKIGEAVRNALLTAVNDAQVAM